MDVTNPSQSPHPSGKAMGPHLLEAFAKTLWGAPPPHGLAPTGRPLQLTVDDDMSEYLFTMPSRQLSVG